MIAGIYNIYCEQGATYLRIFNIETPDDVDPEVFNPLDITNYTARLHMRRLITDEEPFLTLTTENSGIIIQDEGDLGRITVYISAEETAGITSDGVYDLEIISPDEITVQRVLQGKVTLSPEVTR